MSPPKRIDLRDGDLRLQVQASGLIRRLEAAAALVGLTPAAYVRRALVMALDVSEGSGEVTGAVSKGRHLDDVVLGGTKWTDDNPNDELIGPGDLFAQFTSPTPRPA